MYFFFHLFAGAVIGLLIGDILHDRRWVLLCTFGAVIPDIIDKTVGLLVFGDIFGYGRIFSHTCWRHWRFWLPVLPRGNG